MHLVMNSQRYFLRLYKEHDSCLIFIAVWINDKINQRLGQVFNHLV